MKKLLRTIIILVLLIIVFVLVLGLVVSKDYHFEKSITINASQDSVWTMIATLANQQKWEPWKDLDPNMKITTTGVDGTVGATYSWAGNKEVGVGKQTIKAIQAPNRIDVLLQFKEPMENSADSYISVKNDNGKSIATWAFDTKIGYPFNGIMKLCKVMDKQMNKDFGKGLENLKALCEKK